MNTQIYPCSQTGQTRTLRPVYLITTDRRQEVAPDRAADWGIDVAFVGMDVEQNAIHVAVQGATVDAEEWVVVQAAEKPFISVLWLGVLVLLGGFVLAGYRRATEARR